MNKVARQTSATSRARNVAPAAKPQWLSEAAFVGAVIAQARAEIELTSWPATWRAAFKVDDELLDNEPERARLARAAAKALREFLAVEAYADGPFIKQLESAAFILDALGESDEPLDRRSRLVVAIMALAQHDNVRRLTARELALISIVNGWSREVHAGFGKKTVARAITDEAKAMALARQRHAPTMAGDFAERAFAHVKALGLQIHKRRRRSV